MDTTKIAKPSFKGGKKMPVKKGVLATLFKRMRDLPKKPSKK